MMATDNESQKIPKDQMNTGVPTEEEKRKKIEEEGVAEKNPDIEDPRLYSPLQEPDRPAPSERTSEEKKEPEDSSD